MTVQTFVALHPTDVEAQKPLEHLVLEWQNISYSIKGKPILTNVSGSVASGEMLAVMGPSGAGKSTILDVLSKRTPATQGKVAVNGHDRISMKELAAYVEQDDALLGVLTVQETITFAARLSLDPSTPKQVIHERVERVITEFGLTDVRRNRIGNVIQRGISGGQKRRVTLGAGLVTMPKILLLDEPTSGLDSRASYEVLQAVKRVSEQHGMIVIASIHQPNWESFALFDKLLLLAQGRTVYFGPIVSLFLFPSDLLSKYLDKGLSHPVPLHANPADHALDVTSTDFIRDAAQREMRARELAERWEAYAQVHQAEHIPHLTVKFEGGVAIAKKLQNPVGEERRSVLGNLHRGIHQTFILMERNAINYSRNLLAYGVRIGMYLGMGVLLATVWVNLAQTSAKINDRLSVHFYSVAFLGFMSVAGIPAFLEERLVFVRERMNGLYGPAAYVLANSIVTLPYLFLCALLFAVLCYWSIGLNPGVEHFFKFLGVLFLAVYAAESQSAMVAAIIPIFVASLAIASFLNGFWMTYAFNLLVFNDFHGIMLTCAEQNDGSCFCDYPSSLVAQGQCAIAGDDVLEVRKF
ncbi:hypothetical protein A7U60_g4316 [Sanghuangporus baumii]|uniref:ABC transporter domain-containing protein n=1 Tax=Sanghuangporus baumii TaxID=108892 RepID=A0A9Q5N5D7_SANBA|nr:hypothetical protein A7U60_g4316 [Sanghuangporus baumii]